MFKSFDIPPVWALFWALASYVLARFLPVVAFGDAMPGFIGVGGSFLIAVAGFWLVVWSALWFRRKSTPIEPGQVPRALIVEGPYRLSRNPIYTGMTLILFGFALWLGAASAFVGPAGFVWVVTRRFILREEAALRHTFGEKADAYIRSSRRW
ncbi:MAG: methyltransferase [Paracoccaceae bacterium]